MDVITFGEHDYTFMREAFQDRHVSAIAETRQANAESLIVGSFRKYRTLSRRVGSSIPLSLSSCALTFLQLALFSRFLSIIRNLTYVKRLATCFSSHRSERDRKIARGRKFRVANANYPPAIVSNRIKSLALRSLRCKTAPGGF